MISTDHAHVIDAASDEQLATPQHGVADAPRWTTPDDEPATLEIGAAVRIPLCVNVGDRVKAQTATGDDMSRA